MATDNPIPELDQQTVEFLTKLFQDSIVLMRADLDSRITELENNLESAEKQIATLVVGYGEQAVFMEALIGQLVFATDEERKNFNDNLATARKEMLGVMSNASRTFLADTDQRLAESITELVDNQSSDSD